MKVRVLLVLGRFVFGILTLNRKDSLRLGILSRVKILTKSNYISETELSNPLLLLFSTISIATYYSTSYYDKTIQENYHPSELACFCFTKTSILLKSIKVLFTTIVYVLEGCVRLIMLKFGVSGLELVCSFY